MSAPSNPPTAASIAKVTPVLGSNDVTNDATNAPVRLVHSTSELLDLVIDILDEDETIRGEMKKGITTLFIGHTISNLNILEGSFCFVHICGQSYKFCVPVHT
jgi:hypothetical protein